jgi:rhamnose utilization protein RhaD (predicted bifunctional aldolase and dehydrogenase)/NAD(P)-dependent dehydrogenase (short-subunit alcohol dehydrogenase family)
MESRWDEAEAASYPGELGPLVYGSRLLGADPALVLTGGGNTSVKLVATDLWGNEGDVLHVKASGHRLDAIGPDGFTALCLDRLRALLALDHIADERLADELRLAALDPRASPPSVESLLHAVVPHRYVHHSHAEAVLVLTNTPAGSEHVRRIYGDTVIVAPYEQPGFALAKLCSRLVRGRTETAVGLVLTRHGLVTFGNTARESYERHIELVTLAERYLAAHGALEPEPDADDGRELGLELARLRRRISAAAGAPLVLHRDGSGKGTAFARRDDVGELSQSGPATPDHVIWTKRVPLVGRDVDAYADRYRAYFAAHADGQQMLDPAPRIVLDPELGLCAAGATAADAVAAAVIYRRTIDVILQATALGGWEPLSPRAIFDVEYWPLERAKVLPRKGELAGEVVLVTGAASGIGAACVRAFLARGAAVCGLDVNPAVADDYDGAGYLGLECDLTREGAVSAALEVCARRFGGIDMLVLSAGIFPPSARISVLGLDDWRRTFSVNVDADLTLLRSAYPFLELAPQGGRVVVIASKNVAAPGPGAAAYSASKAALTQLARVAALEWGHAGVRVNTIHPNAVFDTGLWTDEMIAARAAHYDVTPEQYRTQNVLGVEVASHDVAELAVAMCGPAFARTTGAQVPVDGGNDRVI